MSTRAHRRLNILAAVVHERERLDARWGEQNHPDGTGGLFQVNALEARQWCEEAFSSGRGTWSDILREEFCEALAEDDPTKLRDELVQVAAVAMAWIEAIDRRGDT